MSNELHQFGSPPFSPLIRKPDRPGACVNNIEIAAKTMVIFWMADGGRGRATKLIPNSLI